MTLRISSFSVILGLIIIPNLASKAAFGYSNETDYQALLAIKSQISLDPSNALSSWNESIHFCAWDGVTCQRKHQRVTSLELPSLHLVGTLSPHVGNLTFLRLLLLHDNNFIGKIPQEISHLSRLDTLFLYRNQFDGELPRNVTGCASLSSLDLNNNNLGGQIPEELGSLVKLNDIRLSNNQFTGHIPPSLGNLSALTRLYLAYNHIKGTIPPHIGKLSNLSILQLSENNLSGFIPPSLYNMSSILVFSIAANYLSGSLPSDLFLKLPKLQEVYLGGNGFSGRIPNAITNASLAEKIDISINSFVGSIPADLGGLKNLQYLNFEYNSLGTEEGDDLSFLTSLVNCTKLQSLSIYQNKLKGILPTSISNFSTTVTRLYLGRNLISGSIPLGIGNLVSLQYLSLHGNKLVGRIPESIGRLSKLQELIIHQNNLSGMIPFSVGNMTALANLWLAKNTLEGMLPASLGNCKHLYELYLSWNRLIGPVPEQLLGPSLGTLLLGTNYFTGPIPSQIGQLVNLEHLDVSVNNMSGEIPSTLGGCLMLESLSLDANHFNGTITPSLSNLRGLQLLDLSRNNFSGQIPGFFANLPLLENLNLSFNMFEGEVPTGRIFSNLSAVSVVGNSKLCGGPTKLNLPKCEEVALKKHGNRKLSRRIVLTISLSVSTLSLLAGIIAAVLYQPKKSRRETTSASSTVDHHPKLTYAELSQATERFSPENMIGEGSFGAVYKGVLPSNGQIVAIKVLKLQERGATKSFMAECEALRNIRHRNLIKTITSCSAVDFRGEDFKALVFEFIPNGSLEKWLHAIPGEIDGTNNTTLNVVQRLNVMIDVATALDYLHHQCSVPIVHCDLKPSNVLLDGDFSAHVSDFGLAKFLIIKESRTQSSLLGIRGTIGYIAPEYGVGGQVSTKGDVYSYGILLLDVFTGKRPTEPMFKGNFGLHEFVEQSLPHHGLVQVIDPLLCLGEVEGNLHHCLVSILHVGLKCSAAHPDERMGIGEALAELQKAQNVLQLHTKKTRVHEP